MMSVKAEDLNNISIFPYYRGVPIEVDAVARNGVGQYVTGQISGHTYYTLTVERAQVEEKLHVGVTYSCTALDHKGNRIRTHWLYCTSVAPILTFGISKHAANPNGFVPMLPHVDTALVHLEELTELVAIFPSSAPEGSLAQARIGLKGWLVMTRVGAPDSIGLLIEEPTLPTAFCEGASNIVIAARSVRTLQSICLDALDCVSTKDTALFLRCEH